MGSVKGKGKFELERENQGQGEGGKEEAQDTCPIGSHSALIYAFHLGFIYRLLSAVSRSPCVREFAMEGETHASSDGRVMV